MSNTNRGLIARWLYEGGPSRLSDRAAHLLQHRPNLPRRAIRHWSAITAVAACAVSAAYALWPRPLEQKLRLPAEAIRLCIAGIAEVPTEYAARKLYRECLVAAREQLDFERRHSVWSEYLKAIEARNQHCMALGYWKPGSKLGSECHIPEPTKPQLW